MQRANCTVRLAGDMLNTVQKNNVSPAEIVILRHIHGGPDAVVDIQPIGMDKTPHRDERERLSVLYKPEVVEAIFPGQFSKLPVTLKEISVEGDALSDLGEDGEPEPSGDIGPSDPILSGDVTVDDRELIDKILTAKTKAELRDMAIENEVDLKDVPDKMDDLQKAIIHGLFPNYQL